MKWTPLTLAAAASLILNPSAFAGEFTVGAAVYKIDSPYKDFKDEDGVAPILSYEGEDFSISEGDLSYRIYGDDEAPLNLRLVLTSAGSGFDSGDSPVFAGMAERDDSIDFGLNAEIEAGPGVVSASLVHDISGTHKGYVADISYGLPLDISDGLSFEPAVGLQYLSGDYSNYYFGVRNSEATASRAAYTPDSAVLPYVGYQLHYALDDNWMLLHEAGYVWLDDEIKNSPLVDKDGVWGTSVGVAYRF